MDAVIFLLFFLCFITFSLASVNIDCGTSLSGVDQNNIKWVGDQDFVKSGLSATVSSTTVENSLTTLRYFPTGDSNCYSNIPVTKGGKVLMRTMFYYQNYDGKFSSPTFEVIFDEKHRDFVSITSSFEPYILEVIFVPAGGVTSVCFVRKSTTSNPFVSSIEVVDIASSMYNELGPGEGLFYQARVAYGTIGFLRSDHHGRFWLSSGPNLLYTVMKSAAISIDTSGASNEPPETVLQHSWSGYGLLLMDQTLPPGGLPVYLAMYFSDPIDTLSSRSFNIFFGGKQVNRSPVVPAFGKTIQVVVRDVVASSTTLLEFRSTASSLFPPLINALEVYVIRKGTSGGGGGSGGGGSGGSGGGGGSGGSGGTGGRNEVNPGESTNEDKNSKLPVILGVVSAVAFVLIVCLIIAFVVRNRRKVKLQGLDTHIPTVANMGTGASPQSGQQMGHDLNQPSNEEEMAYIKELIEVNESYIPQQH